jgi:hypothetical protein
MIAHLTFIVFFAKFFNYIDQSRALYLQVLVNLGQGLVYMLVCKQYHHDFLKNKLLADLMV